MSKILLSIKPEYVERILSNQKKYEFRRTIANQKIETIVIYCTSPVMEVVAEVEVESVVSMEPGELWENTKENAGISKEKYDEYFNGKKIAYAYQLGRIQRFDSPKSLVDFGVKAAPQSFVYV